MRRLRAFLRGFVEGLKARPAEALKPDPLVQYEAPLLLSGGEFREVVLAEWLRASTEGRRGDPVWLN